jgi:hypothetical protein
MSGLTFIVDDVTGNLLVDDADPSIFIVADGAVRLTVTVNQEGSKDGETKNSECLQCAYVLALVAESLVGTQAQTGTVYDRNGLPHTWEYTPTASA